MFIKRQRITSMLLALACMLPFSSCIYDNYGIEDGQGTDEDGTFLSVSFVFAGDVGGSSTRGDFEGTGTDDNGYFFNTGLIEESQITTDSEANWLMAYSNGEFIGAFPLISVKESGATGMGVTYTGVCEVTGKEELVKKIDNLTIALNTNSGVTSMGDITGSIFHVSDGISYHTMSSSTIVNGSGKVEPVTKINEGGIRTYPNRYLALENPSATLFVERLQSKYTVLFNTDSEGADQYFDKDNVYNFAENANNSSQAESNLIVFKPTPPENFKDDEEVTQLFYVDDFDIHKEDIPIVHLGDWKASITGWGINGTEKNSHMFKGLGDNPKDFEKYNFTPSGYNFPVRNMWSVDPNYTTASGYPDQYRPAWDVSGVNAYKNNESNNVLNYMSFKDLSNRGIRQYSTENTFIQPTGEQIADRAQYRCGTTLLVGAQLLIKDFDDDEVFNPKQVDRYGLIYTGADAASKDAKRVKTKYFMNGIYWSEAPYINYFIKYLSSNLNTTADYTPFEGKGDFIPNDVFKPAKDEDIFYVLEDGEYRMADYRYFHIEPLYIKGGDGWGMPYPELDPTDKTLTCLYVCQDNPEAENDENAPKKIYTQIKLSDFEKFAYCFPTYFAKVYNEGRMYYAEPISDSKGMLGAVRNHWYHYRFTTLSNVGIPVQDPDQPIIPTHEPSVIGFGFEVQILPWHIVEEDVNI